MYTDDDLTYATEQGVFSAEAVADFRRLMNERRDSVAVDEENFRLITSFNALGQFYLHFGSDKFNLTNFL